MGGIKGSRGHLLGVFQTLMDKGNRKNKAAQPKKTHEKEEGLREEKAFQRVKVGKAGS